MAKTHYNITIALSLKGGYEHKAALGAIRYARTREDWRLFGSDWLLDTMPRHARYKPDGIIARITRPEDLERLKSYRVPVVDIAGAFDDPAVVTVHNDDRLTGYMAGRHLLSRGLKNFLFVGIAGHAWSEKRLEGMRDALAESGEAALTVKALKPTWAEGETKIAPLAREFRQLALPCGVFAANDLLGYKVTMAAATAGLAIPEQLAVIGVDNEEVYCELAQPAMTSIPCDCETIGGEAAAALDRILSGETPHQRTAISPWPVVARSSTNIMVGDDSLIREVKKYIRQNIAKGINVADVVKAFPLSRRALEMRFNRSGDRTLHGEILAVRLEKACRLLEEGRNATEAALGSGFVTNQHFHHVFKRYMRMTPTAYSDRLRKRDAVHSKRNEATFIPFAPV